MEFLDLPDSYKKYIVKLNVTRKRKDEVREIDNFVFVFSQCKEDSSTYGDVKIGLVPERKIPHFHENLGNMEKTEVKDEHFDEYPLDGKKSVQIGNFVRLLKNKSDFATNYIAAVKDDQTGKETYFLLLTKNQGYLARLENTRYVAFAPKYQKSMLDYENKCKIEKVDQSIENLKELDGLAETFGEIVTQLEQKKSKIVNNMAKEEYLRSLYETGGL